MLTTLATTISLVGNALTLIIFIRALLTLFPAIDPYHPVVRTLDSICNPILSGFRRLMPPVGFIDLSPLLAIFAIELVTRVLVHLLLGLARG